MKRTTKILASALALALVACISVAGTLAYLTSTTGVVTNTFTVGKIEIDLNEHQLKTDGTLDTDALVKGNQYQKVQPGQTLPKDPFVTVTADSEAHYLYVAVNNEIGTALDDTKGKGVDAQIKANGWTEKKTDGNITYYYKNIDAATATAGATLKLFDNITIKGDLTTAESNTLANGAIRIAAYAYQSTGVNEADAWAAVESTLATTVATPAANA